MLALMGGDDEAAAARQRARSSGASGWVRVLLALLLVASATFVGAYYVPLRRAHVLLTEEHQRSSQKGRELEQTLTEMRAELQAKTAVVEKIEAERRQAEAAQKSGRERVEEIELVLSTTLERHIKKGVVAVSVERGRALVALAESAVFAPQTLDVSPQGRQLLCQAASALATSGEAPIRVGAVSDPAHAAPPALQQAHPTPWALSAARAASVAQFLEEKCAIAGARLSAVGHAAHDPAAAALAGSKLPPGRVELAMALPGASPAKD
ncbi:OmpA family protein [Sorangium sp. So ce1036]|uniref:OmpA/MotB family protein n=1 Tax=Sorangium sp. So ce1036 TaxID=3133328 RepID=UPI003F0E33AC